MKKYTKFVKVIVFTAIILLSVVLNNSYCYAQDISQEVIPQKKWTIKFNQKLDSTTVNNNNIMVKDSSNTIVEGTRIVLSKSGQAVEVIAPNDGYISEKNYTLLITKNVRSVTGRKMKNSATRRFRIKRQEYPLVAIMGRQQLTAQQLSQFVLRHNEEPKTSVDILTLAKLFLEEGAIEGIRGDIAFCQSIKETGYFRYGGQVLPEQNNYAGIGATNSSPVGKGAWFKDAREGVRAQIQHLKAYASKQNLHNPCVDPRFHLVTKGVAPNWQDLNGRWAVPGNNYGQEILRIYNQIQGK